VKRSPILPNAPTNIEAGVPNSSYPFWGYFCSLITPPKKIIDQMNESIIKIMKEPQIVAQLNKLGAEPALMSPQKFDQMVKMEMDSAAILVKESKMAVN